MSPRIDSTDQKLLRKLTENGRVSGAELGDALGISRNAVWKRIEQLRELGLPIEAVRGQGYQLSVKLDLLDKAEITASLSDAARSLLRGLRVKLALDSTSASIRRLPETEQHGMAVLAEYQWAGRGRMGRSWHSPLAANVYLSLGWWFDHGASALGCLGLATGVAINRAIARLGVSNGLLKWPNDVRVEGKKLAGCLIEISGDANGPCRAIIGVGLNVAMPKDTPIDQQWTALQHLGVSASRNQTAVALIDELIPAMADYGESQFKHFARDWAMADELIGKPIVISSGEHSIHGIAQGISGSGSLLVDCDGYTREFHAGEVSVRGE